MLQSPPAAALAPERRFLGDTDALKSLGPVTLVGHSHIWCVARAFDTPPDNIRIIDFWSISNPLAMDEAAGLEKIRDQLTGTIISFTGGTRFEALSMYRSQRRPYDFVSPLEPNSPFESDAELVPYDAVRGAVRNLIEHNLMLTAKLRELAIGDVFQVQSPPVWGDERKVEDWNPGFLKPTDRFGSRYVRRKVYNVHTDMVRAFCEERGIAMITPPAGVLDEDGFLKREYSNDLIHATPAYGALMAEKILQTVAAHRGA